MNDEAVREALQQYLHGHGHPGRSLHSFRRLAGGASCRVYAFELDDGRPPLVLRLDTAAGAMPGTRLEEFEMLSVARRAGVTVPAVHFAGSQGDGLGGAFFVMDLVPGEALARRLLRDERYAETRRAMPAQLAGELARLHSIVPDGGTLAFLAARAPAGDDPRRFALAEVARYRDILAAFSTDQPYPLLRLVARWLERHAPAASGPCLVHGDFRVGNVMFDENGLTAVLDWELAHAGDPVEDLGWLCVRAWRFGNDRLAAGGLCTREELLELYAKAGGEQASASSLAWWELFGNWKWAIICRMQAERHRLGKWPDVELAAIGRRVAETEQEILTLLDEAGRRV